MMKNLYKKVARKIFMCAYYDELCEISGDIKETEKLIIDASSINVLSELNKSLGKLEVLEKLDLLS